MIKEFQGKYRWLSNFAPCKIQIDDIIYPSVEHAYMSAKCNKIEWKIFCSTTEKAGDVKRASRSIKLIDDWDAKKLNVMKFCIEQKFNQEPYRSSLIATKDEYLQEGNMWNDKFWGVCLKTNKGENNLGKIIMDKRKRLQALY